MEHRGSVLLLRSVSALRTRLGQGTPLLDISLPGSQSTHDHCCVQVSEEIGIPPQRCEALYREHSLYLNLASNLIQKEAFMGMVQGSQEHKSQARRTLLTAVVSCTSSHDCGVLAQHTSLCCCRFRAFKQRTAPITVSQDVELAVGPQVFLRVMQRVLTASSIHPAST